MSDGFNDAKKEMEEYLAKKANPTHFPNLTEYELLTTRRELQAAISALELILNRVDKTVGEE